MIVVMNIHSWWLIALMRKWFKKSKSNKRRNNPTVQLCQIVFANINQATYFQKNLQMSKMKRIQNPK